MSHERRNAWARAREVGERTPATRNRYVDFLRAVSIVVVVVGHWLVAAAYREDGALRLGSMLQLAPWSQWLTWALQVMPVFFAVGGYSNAVSWESARRSGQSYASWARALLLALAGLAVLVGLVGLAAYPVRMISVPGEPVSNSPIMTLVLWHLTVMVLLIGLANLCGGFGLGLVPDSADWWLSRPLWIATLAVSLLPWVALFGRFERRAHGGRAAPPPAWQLVTGAALLCAALGALARGGIASDDVLSLRLGIVLLAFAAFRLVLGGPLRRAPG